MYLLGETTINLQERSARHPPPKKTPDAHRNPHYRAYHILGEWMNLIYRENRKKKKKMLHPPSSSPVFFFTVNEFLHNLSPS